MEEEWRPLASHSQRTPRSGAKDEHKARGDPLVGRMFVSRRRHPGSANRSCCSPVRLKLVACLSKTPEGEGAEYMFASCVSGQDLWDRLKPGQRSRPAPMGRSTAEG